MKLFFCGKNDSPDFASRLLFPALLTLLFVVINGIGASHHECWRDEMQAWLIARDTPDLSAMLEQEHYEGHPPVWYLLLRTVTLVTHQPEAMQLLTMVLAAVTVFLFCYHAPFSRILKILFVCNYYLLFEYGIVCRIYLPGILLLSVACILYPSARERPWPFALSLLMAAFTSIHCLIVAVAMAAAFLGSWLLPSLRGAQKQEAAAAPFRLLPWLAFAIGVGLAAYSMFPRPDALPVNGYGWNFAWDAESLAKVLFAFWWAYFPLPRPDGYFWIPPWCMPVWSSDNYLVYASLAAIFGGMVFFLRRHISALLFYLVGTLGLLAFFYFKYLGFIRHIGFLFFTFLFALWMKKAGSASGSGRSSLWMERGAEIVLGAMLATQAVTGLWAVREDYYNPFSCGKQAAEFIIEHHLQDKFIAVGADWAGAPLAGYLDRSLYYPNARRYGSFTRFDTQREDISDEEFLRRATEEAKGAEMVISLDHLFSEEFMRLNKIELLASLQGSLTPFESYFLFFVPRQRGFTPGARQENANQRLNPPTPASSPAE